MQEGAHRVFATVRWGHKHVHLRRVVKSVPTEDKPFCAWDSKFKRLAGTSKAFDARPTAIGIAASGPYISSYKQDRLNYLQSKQKWVSDAQFRRFFGKASTGLRQIPGGGVRGSGKFIDPTDRIRDPEDRSKWMNPKRGWRSY